MTSQRADFFFSELHVLAHRFFKVTLQTMQNIDNEPQTHMLLLENVGKSEVDATWHLTAISY